MRRGNDLLLWLDNSADVRFFPASLYLEESYHREKSTFAMVESSGMKTHSGNLKAHANIDDRDRSAVLLLASSRSSAVALANQTSAPIRGAARAKRCHLTFEQNKRWCFSSIPICYIRSFACAFLRRLRTSCTCRSIAFRVLFTRR